MQLDMQAKVRKSWKAPALTIHGNVEQITLAPTKKWGWNDGIIQDIIVDGQDVGNIAIGEPGKSDKGSYISFS